MSETDKILPLDSWHRVRGARMVPFAGYQMPIQYEGIIAEHRWTRDSAGLFDVSHMGQLTVTGTDLDTALEAILPADLSLLKEGRLRYSLLLNEEGGILDDLMVTRRADHFYLVVNGATKQGDIAHFRSRLAACASLEHLDQQALLALQGPMAVDVLSRVAPGAETLTFMTGGSFEVGGVPAWISRSGYTGEDGFEISVAASAVEAVACRSTATTSTNVPPPSRRTLPSRYPSGGGKRGAFPAPPGSNRNWRAARLAAAWVSLFLAVSLSARARSSSTRKAMR
jgi:aminomethyltransferase